MNRALFPLLLLAGTAPVAAQDHAGHEHPAAPEPPASHEDHASAPQDAEVQDEHPAEHAEESVTEHAAGGQASSDDAAMDHSSMDHSTMDHSAMGHSGMDRSTDHSTMDHSQMDPSSMDRSSVPHAQSGAGHEQPAQGAPPHAGHAVEAPGSGEGAIPQAPPPPEAFEGPAHAADLFIDPAVMAASRAEVAREVSGMPVLWLQGERLEYRARDGDDGYLWDLQGYYGGDYDKIWFKSEGEGSFGETPESAEVQALWSHAIGPWFDLQAGVRQDLVGRERTHAVLGVQGLAPYLFEVDAAAFLSTRGDLTARIEAELDQRITQRLILQPRAEIALSAQDIPELGIGAGIDRIETGLRLRYEIVREFAPYIGIEQEWLLGDSADYARAAGEDPSVTNFVAGLRFWF